MIGRLDVVEDGKTCGRNRFVRDPLLLIFRVLLIFRGQLVDWRE
jgi:hypothetical protein